jgi:hypothetical protein
MKRKIWVENKVASVTCNGNCGHLFGVAADREDQIS